MNREAQGFVAHSIGLRKEEIRKEMYKVIALNVPDPDHVTSTVIATCMRDCAKLKREYESLTTAYNLLFVTPYNGE
tara:strand:- start:39579 stop:39806 length:228 start_codon:yes stop_codon:yes gene_type:complete